MNGLGGSLADLWSNVLPAAFVRVLPALIMGVMAIFKPPQSEKGWMLFLAIAVAATAANTPQHDVAGDK